MAHTHDERARLLAEARTAHREADRERGRAKRLAARLARRVKHALDSGRAKLDADRAALEERIARFNATQSEFNAAGAADRERARAAWAELDARQKRMAAEWEETSRFQAEQAAALDARAAALAAQERTEADLKAKLQREVAALHAEVAALDVRARNARQHVEELEHRRAELRTAVPVSQPAPELPEAAQVALDRAADRDLGRLAAELADREQRLKLERAAVQSLYEALAADKSTLADRRRVLAEQFAQLAQARALWQEAERATVAEMEQLAQRLRRREAELDAREARLVRADGRRRADAYELWQLRLRLEAWQSKLVAYEMRWHTEREHVEADIARRLEAVVQRESLLAQEPAGGADAVPFGLVVPEEPGAPAASMELAALREELERMAAVLLEAELPEPPDAPESELPWGSEEAPAAGAGPSESDVLLFEPIVQAA